MKLAYVMQNYDAAAEAWLRRQISFLKDKINFLSAIDNKVSSLDGIPVVNLYGDYPILYKLLMKIGFMRKRSREERFNYVFERSLKRYKPDIILINYLTLAYRLKKSILNHNGKIFIQVHGYDVTWDFISVENGIARHNQKYKEFAKLISSKATYIANSKFTKYNLMNAGVPENKIEVKYFGVPLEKGIRQNKYKNDKEIKILYLGRLVDCKAPDLVIKAFEYACNLGIRAQLIIAGDGYLMNTCRLLKGRSLYRNKIALLGAVTSEEGAQLRADCDIFTAHNCVGAITNQVEAFGVSIIEAMSAGLPVVTGKSGGVMESVVDGETGYLFSPGDVEQHGELLYKLANAPELRKTFGMNAIKRVKQKFTLENEKSKLLQILEK